MADRKPRKPAPKDTNQRDWGKDGRKSALLLNRNTRKLMQQVEGMGTPPKPRRP
jgi:hypothetical protein